MKAGLLVPSSLTFAVALAGCAAGPDYRRPELDLAPAYLNTADLPLSNEPLWWRGFDDPELNRVVQRTLDANVDIAGALARVDAAEATVRAASAGLFPVVGASVSGDVSGLLSGDGAEESGGEIGISASFFPDLFGAQRRAIEATRAGARAQRDLLSDARRLAAAAAADRYIEARRTAARLDLLDVSLDLQQQTLEIVSQRFEAGLSADLDVRRAEADLSRTRAQRGTLDIAKAQAEYTLAVLQGEGPSSGLGALAGEPAIPAFAGGPPVGVPADLLRRRPDVRAAEAQLAAATAAIGIEAADLFPTLSLAGAITGEIGGSQSIADSAFGIVAAAIDLTIFDAGRRRAEIAGAEARAREALHAYRGTLLDSLVEVETSLVAIEALEERRAQFETAVTASEAAFEQLNALYREGLASFIDILDAQRTLIGSRESFVDSEADLAAAIVALYAAIGSPSSLQPGQD